MMASSVTDKELRGELVRHARNYRERAPVFGINQPVPEESLAQARDLALAIWNPTLACLLIPRSSVTIRLLSSFQITGM